MLRRIANLRLCKASKTSSKRRSTESKRASILSGMTSVCSSTVFARWLRTTSRLLPTIMDNTMRALGMPMESSSWMFVTIVPSTAAMVAEREGYQV